MSEGIHKQVQYAESLVDTDTAIKGIHKALRMVCAELEQLGRANRMLDNRVEELEAFHVALSDVMREFSDE